MNTEKEAKLLSAINRAIDIELAQKQAHATMRELIFTLRIELECAKRDLKSSDIHFLINVDQAPGKFTWRQKFAGCIAGMQMKDGEKVFFDVPIPRWVTHV